MTEQIKLRIEWMERNDPELYEKLQNQRCIEDVDLEYWLDEHHVPKVAV
jgi:hypothetical protein